MNSISKLNITKSSNKELIQDAEENLNIKIIPSEYPAGSFLTIIEDEEVFLHDGTKTKDGYGAIIGQTGGIWMKSNGYGYFCYGCDVRLATQKEIEKFIVDIHKASLIKG